MITTTHGGETLVSFRIDWLEVTELAAAIALGIIIAVVWLEIAGVHSHG